jgi:hypothetical protein
MSQEQALRLATTYPSDEDKDALTAGAAIATGDFSRRNLERIFRWKTRDRGKSRLSRNSDEEIRDCLRLAVNAATPRAAIAVLTGLYGVDTPVASAIMTAVRPQAFTILDFRALDALGCQTDNRSIPFYLVYLEYCNNQANRWGMTLRQLDRALWQWSREQSEM